MELPSEAAIAAFHKAHAPNASALAIVYTHCQIVADVAAELIRSNKLTVDERFVRAAALLHDVGYYPLFDTSGYVPRQLTLTHGVVGTKLLREADMPERIARVAERHTGVGLTKAYILAAKLPLPPRDLVPETPEEWLILYADKFHTKHISQTDFQDHLGRFITMEDYVRHAVRFGTDNAARFTTLVEQYGVPDLQRLSKRYQQPIA